MKPQTRVTAMMRDRLGDGADLTHYGMGLLLACEAVDALVVIALALSAAAGQRVLTYVCPGCGDVKTLVNISDSDTPLGMYSFLCNACGWMGNIRKPKTESTDDE